MDGKELDACIETWKITKSMQKLAKMVMDSILSRADLI